MALSAALALLSAVGAQKQGDRLLTVQDVKKLSVEAKCFALVIGVDEYQDPLISRLSGATNDAKALSDALVRYAGSPQDQVKWLTADQLPASQPSRGNILQCLANLRGLIAKDGLMLVSFAGHGIERNGLGFPTSAELSRRFSALFGRGDCERMVWRLRTGALDYLPCRFSYSFLSH